MSSSWCVPAFACSGVVGSANAAVTSAKTRCLSNRPHVAASARSARCSIAPVSSIAGLKQCEPAKFRGNTRMCSESAGDAPCDEVPEEFTELSRLEIRVGVVVECEAHPDADSLYIEKIDVGEEEPRTIVSGLVNFISAEELTGRKVVVLCNLKPRAMRGVTSAGMLLCASNEDHTAVDPLCPPEEAEVGSLITFTGHKAEPMAAGNRASKAFSKVADSFSTNEDGVAMFDDIPFATAAGPCFSPKKLVGTVS